MDPNLKTALAELDKQFDTCFTWWGQVYDPSTGGCYYCLSGKNARAKGQEKFGPDIEATSKLVNVLEWTGALDQAPQAFKDGVIKYMQKRQDPQSGFFRDPEFAKYYGPKTLNRAVGMASGSIEKCGGKAKYPLPIEQTENNEEAKKHFAHLESNETLEQWLNALPWNHRIWTCGSSIRAQSGIFKALPEEKRKELLDCVEAFYAKRQHADGYYGTPEEDKWFSRLSGTYKALAFLEMQGREVPMVDRLVKTVLNDLNTQKYTNLIVLYNTANILTILNRNGANFNVEQRVDIIQKCTAVLKQFHAKDGGFLTDTARPRPSANGKPLGKNVMESNTNSTGLAHKTRNLLWELATGEFISRTHPRCQDLLKALQAKD